MRFRFTIRDLLLLTAIVALTIGWWLDHRKLTRENSVQLTVYSLAHLDAKSAAANLERVYFGDTAVRIAADPQQNRVIVRAPSQRHLEIEAILMKLDVPATTF